MCEEEGLVHKASHQSAGGPLKSTSMSAWPSLGLLFLAGLELDAAELPDQMSFSDWPELAKIFADRFASKSQAEWAQIFDGTDACVTPVLTFEEVSSHPHNRERASFIEDAGGQESPRPAPVLSRTPAEPGLALDPAIGEHTVEVLREFGFSPAHIDHMLAAGVVEGHAIKAKL